MIKAEYILLPIKNLSQEMYFKLSGEINTNWRYGQLSVTHLMNDPNKEPCKYKDFFRRQAAAMMANLKNESAGELTQYNDMPVKLIELKPNSDFEEKFADNTYRAEETNKIMFEYVHLPLIDVKYNFLWRFVAPLPTVWQLDSLEPMFREVEQLDGERVRQFNKHRSLDEVFKHGVYVRGKFSDLLYSAGGSPRDLPRQLAWMQELKDFEVIECKLEEVVMEENDSVTIGKGL